MKKPQTVTVIIDAPCPLCHRDDTSGPYTCKRCGLEVCKECQEVSTIGLDKNKQRILCNPCVTGVEADLALEALEGDKKKEMTQNDMVEMLRQIEREKHKAKKFAGYHQSPHPFPLDIFPKASWNV